MNEQRIAVCKAILQQVSQVLNSSPQDWHSQVPSGRSVIESLDSSTLMDSPQRVEEQIWVIDQLQKLAYSDPDSGGVHDIADWCLNKWLQILPYHSQEVRILQGESKKLVCAFLFQRRVENFSLGNILGGCAGLLTIRAGIGHWWLLKAQPSLARVHAIDGSSSSCSSGTSLGQTGHGLLLSRSEEDRQAAGAAAEAEMRVNTSDYVEARGLLVPATEYLARGVEWAVHHNNVGGQLLALV